MSDTLHENVVPLDEALRKSGTRFTAAELQTKNYPPVKFIVPGYIPEGLTLLAGKPKQGKSWLCLDIAVAISSGRYVLGDVPCEEGDVLYLALEDNGRRLQERLHKLLPEREWPRRLTFELVSKPLDDGGLDPLCKWITRAESPRLLIVDVFAKIRGKSDNRDTLHSADYKAVMGLHDLASEHGIAVIIVHHLRKMGSDDPFDTISGSTGFTGACDTMLVLKRTSEGVVLYGTGRDIEGFEKAIKFNPDTCRWTVRGDASDVLRSEQRGKILLALEESTEPMKPQDIADETGMKSTNVRQMLLRMAKDGNVEKAGRGIYQLPSQGAVTTVTSVTNS